MLSPTRVAALMLAIAASAGPAFGREPVPSDDDIRQILIHESISAYSGSCPCPYNIARNGSRCGKRSAYSRPGGAAPLCYPDDVPQEMVARYRKSHGVARR